MKILVIDNYDSFTYNLVQYLMEITGEELDVFRNDEITLEAVEAYDVIILSPGPGLPKDAGIMPALIQKYASSKSIFGVCLGMQAIGEAYGGDLRNLDKVYHGISTPIEITKSTEPIFEDMETVFEAGRYHSWVVEKDSLPKELEITAEDSKGEIMALSHQTYNLRGVQFHPESVMTPAGKQILRNFLNHSKSLLQKNELASAK